MGLDMYLDKRTYVKQWDHIEETKQYKVEVTRGGEPTNIDPKKVKYIIEEAGYWRKANAIHKWFVDNCQDGVDDCRDAYVGFKELQTLLDLCRIVIIDKSKAEQLLPSTSGFFFGNTEYDEWYYNDIQNTIEILEKALEDKDGEYYYSSSW
jgi:hypothetical protein